MNQILNVSSSSTIESIRLETEPKISLTKTTLNDLIIFQKWFRENTENYKYLLGANLVADQNLAQELYKSYEKSIHLGKRLAYTAREKDRIIGYIDFRSSDKNKINQELEISIFLSPHHLGQKYGERILKKAVSDLFDNPSNENIIKLTLGVYPQNIPAVCCYLKCGFLPREQQLVTETGEKVQANWRVMISESLRTGEPMQLDFTRIQNSIDVRQLIDYQTEFKAFQTAFIKAILDTRPVWRV